MNSLAFNRFAFPLRAREQTHLDGEDRLVRFDTLEADPTGQSAGAQIAVKDLTKGSIVSHILIMAAPVAFFMLTQIAYQLVDLYFVTKLGVAATAGVSAAGNAMFIVAALTQVLGVGTAALIAQAVGRKDQADANLVFNQSMMLSAVCGVITIALLYVFVHPYLRSVAADAATIDAGARA